MRVSSDTNLSNVIENSTNLHLTCNVIDAHPAVMYYKWYKDGTKVATESQIYTLSTVHRSHSGSYSCEASNTVGSSGPSSGLQLDVLCKFNILLLNLDYQHLKEAGNVFDFTNNRISYNLLNMHLLTYFGMNQQKFKPTHRFEMRIVFKKN